MEINFKVELKDAFGKTVMIIERDKTTGEVSKSMPVIVNEELVNLLAHPKSSKSSEPASQMQVLHRMTLSMKIAAGASADYDEDELLIIRETVMTLYNEKLISLILAARILELIKSK